MFTNFCNGVKATIMLITIAVIETPVSPSELRGTTSISITIRPATAALTKNIIGMLKYNLNLKAIKMLKKAMLKGTPINIRRIVTEAMWKQS